MVTNCNNAEVNFSAWIVHLCPMTNCFRPQTQQSQWHQPSIMVLNYFILLLFFTVVTALEEEEEEPPLAYIAITGRERITRCSLSCSHFHSCSCYCLNSCSFWFLTTRYSLAPVTTLGWNAGLIGTSTSEYLLSFPDNPLCPARSVDCPGLCFAMSEVCCGL